MVSLQVSLLKLNLVSRLVKSRHGIYYLRLQRGGIDKRISLRTRDLSIATIAAHSLGATILSMDLKKIKGYTLKTSSEGVEITTDGTPEDHERAKDALIALVMAQAQLKNGSSQAFPNATSKTAIKLVDSIKDYVSDLSKSYQAEKSKKMAISTLNGLMDLLGHEFLAEQLNDEVLENNWLPARLKQVAKTTIKRDLSFIRSYSTWASSPSRNHLPAPLTFKIEAKGEHWSYLNSNDLKLIFDGLTEHAKKPWHFYIPLIGLFTGARIGEIASLKTEHIYVKSGLNVMHLPGTKTDASPRDVPIHPTLVELGLLKLAEIRKNTGQEMLFDITPSAQNGYGAAPSKWFTQYKNKISLLGDNKVFHSFRHTIIDHMNQLDVPFAHQCQYTGHDKGGGVHNKVYGREALSLKSIQTNVIEKLNWLEYCGWELDEKKLIVVAYRFLK